MFVLHGHSQYQQQTRYESLPSLTSSLFRCALLCPYPTWHGGRSDGELAGYTSTVRTQCRY